MRYLFLPAIVLFFFIQPSFGQLNMLSISAMQQQKATALAQQSLEELVLLARQTNIKELGFADEKQVREAKLGQPVSDYLVRLDELKEYQPGHPARDLIHATGRLLYPLLVNQQALSAVTLTFYQEKWAVESFGGANQIRMITALTKKLDQSGDQPGQGFFQVRIPALQLLFIGWEHDTAITLVPLFDMLSYGMLEGQRYQAEQVLEKLVEAARQHNGDPT